MSSASLDETFLKYVWFGLTGTPYSVISSVVGFQPVVNVVTEDAMTPGISTLVMNRIVYKGNNKITEHRAINGPHSVAFLPQRRYLLLNSVIYFAHDFRETDTFVFNTKCLLAAKP